MKLSQTTLFAILATSAFVSAAPTNVVAENSLVTRGDANEIIDILTALKDVNEKRDLVSESESFELSKRADGLVTELVAALASSGIIADVWNTLTQDETLRSEILTIVKTTVKAALVQGPALLKAIWDSGLISKLFKDVINDSDLRSVLLRVAKATFSSALNLLKAYKSNKSSATATAVSVETDTAVAVAITTDSSVATGSSDTGNIPSPSQYNAGYKRDFIDGEYLDKRDVASIVTTVVQQVKDSGLVSSLIQKVLADPEKSISFLSNLLKKGYVLAEDLISWAKSSGLLDDALAYFEKNGGQYSSALASFLGNQIDSGNVTASEIDNADSSAAAGTTIATTAAITQVTTAATTATTLQVKRRAY
ncbi:uncharacterized protein AC631_00030 [Debaryomyces fabryi]|uniref:Opaque-phase-specific protein OP4 n=1 Tax=Debaryomyces fabryi TaxID=58627 RepID=A0A0V1Q7I4_9ASCO|nr:uncharacterized protein AC631_00030 [Debaryomyces fabryi]KSA04159.1 hypothetical protein AC631_00030 [Debaryomyces fabryi]CUM46215.1 unnamed protein product [Debaryomyces fabryi]